MCDPIGWSIHWANPSLTTGKATGDPINKPTSGHQWSLVVTGGFIDRVTGRFIDGVTGGFTGQTQQQQILSF